MLQQRTGALRVRDSRPVHTHFLSSMKVEKSDVKIGVSAFTHLCWILHWNRSALLIYAEGVATPYRNKQVFPVWFSLIAFSVFDGTTQKNSHKTDACRQFRLLPAGTWMKKRNTLMETIILCMFPKRGNFYLFIFFGDTSQQNNKQPFPSLPQVSSHPSWLTCWTLTLMFC